MNLLNFHEKISLDERNGEEANPSRFFSEQVTMFNILNGTFPDQDIINIRVIREDFPTFAITLANENIASCAEQNLNNQVVPGAYKPLYKLDVSRNDNTLFFRMEEI